MISMVSTNIHRCSITFQVNVLSKYRQDLNQIVEKFFKLEDDFREMSDTRDRLGVGTVIVGEEKFDDKLALVTGRVTVGLYL